MTVWELLRRRRQGRDGGDVVRASNDRLFSEFGLNSFSYQSPVQPITCLDLHSTGRFMLSGSADGTISLFDVESSDFIAPLPSKTLPSKKWRNVRQFKPRQVNSSAHGHCDNVAWYWQDTGLFSTSDMNEVKIWDAMNFRPVVTVRTPNSKICHAISAGTCNRLLAVCMEEGGLQSLDLGAGRFVMDFKGHRDNVFDAAWHPSKKHLFVSCSKDGTARVWDSRRGDQQLYSLDIGRPPPTADDLVESDFQYYTHIQANDRFDSNEHMLSKKERRELANDLWTNVVRDNYDGRQSAAIASLRNDHGINAGFGHGGSHARPAYTGPIMGIKFAGENEVVTLGGDGVAKRWDFHTGTCIDQVAYRMNARPHPSRRAPLCTIPSSGSFLCAERNSIIYHSGQRVLGQHPSHRLGPKVKLHADDEADEDRDRHFRRMDLRNLEDYHGTLTGHLAPIWSLCSDPKGLRIFSGAQDGLIIEWSLPQSQPDFFFDEKNPYPPADTFSSCSEDETQAMLQDASRPKAKSKARSKAKAKSKGSAKKRPKKEPQKAITAGFGLDDL